MASRSSATLRFTNLKLRNWRNFPTVDVAFEKRAFIVGPNASGKSNLVDAMRFLSEIARPGSGGLQAAIKIREGFSSIRCLEARNPSHVEIHAQIGTDDNPSQWQYILQLNSIKKEAMPTVVKESVQLHGIDVSSQMRAKNSDPLLYSQTMLEQVTASEKFRELSMFLASCRYLHVVPQIVRERARGRLEGEDPYGGDLLRRIKDTPKKTRDPRLRRIAEALQIAVPQFRELELLDDNQGVPHLLASYQHWRGRAAKQQETLFSDGTLRLIGLLWSIAEKGGPLLLEEPELSLNDAVVSQLPKMFQTMQRISGRQVITTTHSDRLLDHESVGLKEIHRIFVDSNGSHVETASNNPLITAQVDGGLTPSQAVFPFIQPLNIEKLGTINVAA